MYENHYTYSNLCGNFRIREVTFVCFQADFLGVEHGRELLHRHRVVPPANTHPVRTISGRARLGREQKSFM